MKLVLSLLFIMSIQAAGFSQNKETVSQSKFSILIETLSLNPDESTDLLLELESKGVYSFKISDSLIIPSGSILLIKDLATGNIFTLNSSEPHSFSVNRAMTKKFRIQLSSVTILAVK